MIPTRIHGFIDYAYGLLLLVAPYLFGFADGGAAQWVMMAFGLGAIAYSLVTDYELGLLKLIPMRVHLSLDSGAGAVLIVAPWMFDFEDRIIWPYVVFGAASVIIPILTQHRMSYASQ